MKEFKTKEIKCKCNCDHEVSKQLELFNNYITFKMELINKELNSFEESIIKIHEINSESSNNRKINKIEKSIMRYVEELEDSLFSLAERIYSLENKINYDAP